MKLRYQMRGLGIGIIVTALLMGVVKGEKVPLSDAEIRIRALELGMVEGDSRKLSDIPVSSGDRQEPDGSSVGEGGTEPLPGDEGSQPLPGDEGSQPPSGEEGAEQGDSAAGENPGPPEGDDGPQNLPGGQEGANAPGESGDEESGEGGPAEESAEPVTFVIESGATSQDVCRQLEELGLVEDAGEFETYLYQKSYSRSIRAETYEIARGTSMEEIAQIITGN